jgi:hypothetical protein
LLVPVCNCDSGCGGRSYTGGKPRFERIGAFTHQSGEHRLRSARFANHPEGPRSSVRLGPGGYGRHFGTGRLGFQHELNRLAGERLTASVEDAYLYRVLQGRSGNTGLVVATSDPELRGCAVTWQNEIAPAAAVQGRKGESDTGNQTGEPLHGGQALVKAARQHMLSRGQPGRYGVHHN